MAVIIDLFCVIRIFYSRSLTQVPDSSGRVDLKKKKLHLLCFGLQQNSAADLSMLVLEVLEKSETKVEDEILGGCKTLSFKVHLQDFL